MPKDVVLDYTIGDGSCFVAGDLCGHFIIGLEDREVLGGCAEQHLVDVLGGPKEKLKEVQTQEEDKGEDSDDEFSPRTRRQVGTSGTLRGPFDNFDL